MRTCTKCGAAKPLAEFSKNAQKRDGLNPRCKACDKVAKAAYRAVPANRETEKAGTSKYRAENRDKCKAATAKWNAANPGRAKVTTAKWTAANPGRAKANSDRWHADNPDKVKISAAKHYAKNTLALRASNTKWKAVNSGAVLIHNHNHRARKRENGGTLSTGLASTLFTLQGGKCACGCKQPLVDGYHLDHIMPISLGGTNTDYNIQLLRAKCNLKKSATDPITFMRQKGFLL